ncbi:hypothetical protein, partial [Falsiroseomonas oryzae]|uniref:hypothetical protein n=1 Tax=Falsiroseomonas oryzae TaxID=2766473 RepID=UPI0022EA7B21
MSDLWKAGAKVGPDGVTISHADYQAQLAEAVRNRVRQDVGDDMMRRVKRFWAPVVFVIGLVGTGAFWQYVNSVVVRPFEAYQQTATRRFEDFQRDIRRQLETMQAEIDQRAREQVQITLMRLTADAAQAQVAVQQRVVSAIGDPESPIGKRIAEETESRVRALIGNREQRDRLERTVLRAEIIDREREPARRANAFAHLMLLDPGGTERLDVLRQVLGPSAATPREQDAVGRIVLAYLDPAERVGPPPDAALGQLALARHAEGALSLDAATRLLRTMPA